MSRGEIMGPLQGLPHAVKDILAVKGMPLTFGSPILKDFVPGADQAAIGQLHRHCAAILHHDHAIDQPQHRRAMGDQQQGAISELDRQALDQPRLGLRIHGAGRLVEHHHPG